MDSNARNGFLLGAAIIIVIAFIINGPPFIPKPADKGEPNEVIPDESPGIFPIIPPEVFQQDHIHGQNPEENKSQENKEDSIDPIIEVSSPVKIDYHTEPEKQAWPKVHIVSKGENLADIAKEYYGPKEGNRRVNITRIFEANSKLLESPDEIYPGQKLIIPQL
jgi:nucleoid-associated protein YgaU